MEVELKWPKISWTFFGFQKKYKVTNFNTFSAQISNLIQNASRSSEKGVSKVPCSQGGSPLMSSRKLHPASNHDSHVHESWFEAGWWFFTMGWMTLGGTLPLRAWYFVPRFLRAPWSVLDKIWNLCRKWFNFDDMIFFGNRNFSWYFWSL